jgi:mRNA-degrading endonuclease RelE of RelBE toxin-antitoxin system
MVTIEFTIDFEKCIKKIKDNSVKDKVKKQIGKIIEFPEIGKPMMHDRKGTREVYVPPYRLSYAFIKDESKLIFLDFYHKDEQ